MMGIVFLWLSLHLLLYDDDFQFSTTAAYNKSSPNIHLLGISYYIFLIKENDEEEKENLVKTSSSFPFARKKWYTYLLAWHIKIYEDL